MRIPNNDVRLYVDIDGSGLVADDPTLHEKPTLILLHGGMPQPFNEVVVNHLRSFITGSQT